MLSCDSSTVGLLLQLKLWILKHFSASSPHSALLLCRTGPPNRVQLSDSLWKVSDLWSGPLLFPLSSKGRNKYSDSAQPYFYSWFLLLMFSCNLFVTLQPEFSFIFGIFTTRATVLTFCVLIYFFYPHLFFLVKVGFITVCWFSCFPFISTAQMPGTTR